MFLQYLRHFSKTLDFACASRKQNQGFWKNGEQVILSNLLELFPIKSEEAISKIFASVW